MNVEVKTWKGILPKKREWGNIPIQILPDDIYNSFGELENKIMDNLASHSIPCSDGCFVPNAIFDDWLKIHNDYSERFNKAKLLVLSCCEDVREAARSAAAIKQVEVWNSKHPLDKFPPPSSTAYASNLASSLIPSKEDFYSLYKVNIRVNSHSFCFMASNPRCSFLEQGEKRGIAWMVVNELVANNAKRFANSLNRMIVTTKLMGKKAKGVFEACKLFLDTDIFPNDCLRSKVQRLMDTVESKTFDQINQNEFNIAYEEARIFAIRMSEVSVIMEFL